MGTDFHLARLGAVATVVGTVLFLTATLMHPMESEPNDAAAAFAEYAADSLWVWSHLAQFAGVAVLTIALVALAGTLEPGRPAAWGRVGLVGAAATLAAAAALQAVDGVALKIMVDRLAASSGDARPLAFEAAFAVRQIEVGLASLLSVLFGFTASVFGIATLLSSRYPVWLGLIGLLVGIGLVAAGAAEARTGFSGLGMTLSMLASFVLLIWFILLAVLMWRLAPRLDETLT